jgi:putative flippase GtrA
MHYAPAAFFTWLPTTTVGFLLNRRFTFNLRGKSDRHRQFLLYLSGSVLQMFISIVGYTVLFDVLNSPVTLAFFVNLIVTTAFSFAFMNRITFRLQNV